MTLGVSHWRTWAGDADERAGRTWVQAFASTLITGAVGFLHLGLLPSAVAIATGSAVFSVLFSLAARWFGQPGTASLLRKVFYQ